MEMSTRVPLMQRRKLGEGRRETEGYSLLSGCREISSFYMLEREILFSREISKVLKYFVRSHEEKFYVMQY